MTIRGSCLCGDLAWEAEGPLQLEHHCHCSRCRKAHGTPFATFGGVPAQGFRWLRGADGIRRYESSPDNHRPFCGRCGSSVPGEPSDGRVGMPLGGLDGDPPVRVLAHIFAASKAPWYEISDELPCFDAYPPGFDLPVLAEPERPAPATGRIGGSCLCGGVAFEVELPFRIMRSCHCQRCRKARSAAHATNLLTDPHRFGWTRGAELVDSYKVPEAERFTQSFCRTCGSPMPRVFEARGYVVVPAGSLDGDPGTRVQEHIFVGSKAPWFEIRDGVAQYDESPPDAG
ncbi:MAG: GFA family protein [Proteobacteria bacterium]|nr:GFA family protein [Pseudomonadota bacterium]